MKVAREKSIIEYFYHWEKETPDNIFLKQPFGEEFVDFSWKEAGIQIRKISSYLKSLNLPPKTNIALISKNCAEWIITDLAIIQSGNVSVPLYPTLTGPQINQVLEHSGSPVAFIGKIDNWQEMKSGIPKEVNCVSFPTYNPDPSHTQWNDILEKFPVDNSTFIPNLEELHTIIYTSGTTGNPKGVMLNFKAASECIYETRNFTFLERPGTRFFSYLPLCHIAERNIVESVCIVTGGVIYFAENLETFSKNLQVANPTHFLAVPRIWTKFQQGILLKLPQKKLDLLLSIPIVSGLIKKKIKKGLGLNDAWICLTGAAPMPLSLILWFRKVGINIQEAYGMTENAGAVTMMPGNKSVDGSVGKIYPGMEVKIDPANGEILTRSKWNMMGYYKEPQMTADTIDSEGYIHTGDVGEVDAEGFLKITGRVKEMYKTSKGEYVAPAQIEMGFSGNPEIEQVCVVGQSLPQPIALMVLSDYGKTIHKETIEEKLKAVLKDLNNSLKSYEKINKIVLLKEPWTVENNKMTPTMKIKRNVIEKEFEKKYEDWFESPGTLIFE
ncbi:AMP-dependent synthetase [Lacihabitans sp. LS3-19]|uniref:AMP-binding protein n=1 Tax=Lacihabitans sp. LS3-19 TaxID=2487335 RepID=UPI0020CFABCD|nr:AMP-binding protein [Lacihabitans sp. LS3-19]MCP9770309.1 AMP-dependent synthetase [Lacihabitans sp. LS3-19]